MKRETYFAVTGIVGILFAIGFLLAPAMSLANYGMPTEAPNQLQARYFGSALLAVGLVSFLSRKTQDPVAVRGLLVAGLVSNIVGAAISLMAVPMQNRMVWLSVAIYTLFAAGGAYFLFADKPRAHAQAA